MLDELSSKSESNNKEEKKQQNYPRSTESFEKALEEACKINPEVEQHIPYLRKTKMLESGKKDCTIQNTAGAPYYGWF